MMDTWATFWGWFLIAVLSVFAMLAVVIAIGGFSDVKALFATIDRQHDRQHDKQHEIKHGGGHESADDGKPHA